MIDVHCHLEYMEEPEKVVKEARKRMAGIITSIADPKHNEEIMRIRNKHKEFVFLSIGLHPTRALKYSKEEIEKHIEYIRSNRDRIVAIGETGLDYFHVKDNVGRKKTKQIFTRFIELANELQLPLIIHARDCMDEVLELLKKADVPVVMHFFSGDDAQLEYALGKGYWISFTTIVCVSKKYRKLAKKTPLEQMLLETDAPWLDPDNIGGKGLTNRPWKIEKSAEVIAKLKKTTKEEVLKATEENAKKVFRV